MVTSVLLETAAADVPNWFAVSMGVGTVFAGLICIIIICKIVGLFCKSGSGKDKPSAKAAENMPAPIENGQEIIAAVTAVCAEEMGRDVSALRVVSFKKI